MTDRFKASTMKEWGAAIECGDGWNACGYGHTKKRTKGRKRIRRAARHKLKNELRRTVEAYYE